MNWNRSRSTVNNTLPFSHGDTATTNRHGGHRLGVHSPLGYAPSRVDGVPLLEVSPQRGDEPAAVVDLASIAYFFLLRRRDAS